MTPSGAVVRQALPGDLAGVVALERSVREAPHWGMAEYEAALRQSPQEWVRRRLVVAVRGTALLGFAVGKVAGATGELESLVVVGAERRRGMGRALCAEALAFCRRQGAETVELEVRASSEAAVALYLSMAFEAVGRRQRYYRNPPDDAILMRLKLRADAALPR